MKTERIHEIYTILKQVIPLPRVESISFHDIVEVHQKCDDFVGTLKKFLIEVTLDIDRLELLISGKEDYYNVVIEERVMSGGPDFVGCLTDTAKLRRSRYLLRAEGAELSELKAELSASKGLQKIIREHRGDIEGKNNTAKKLWEMHLTEQKIFDPTTRPTKAVTFSDPYFENTVRGMASGGDESSDDQLGATVDFQKNSTSEAFAGDLYAKSHEQNDEEKHNSKNNIGSAPIIKEGDDLLDIIDRL